MHVIFLNTLVEIMKGCSWVREMHRILVVGKWANYFCKYSKLTKNIVNIDECGCLHFLTCMLAMIEIG